MRRCFVSCLLFLFPFCLGSAAHASPPPPVSVSLVKEDVWADRTVREESRGVEITLTFGDECVVIHEDSLSFPEGRLVARDVSPDQLYLVRDLRPMVRRKGYDSLYSHGGFQLAVVKDPAGLTRVKRVSLRPVTGSVVVLERSKVQRLEPNPKVERLLRMLDSAHYEQCLSALAEDQPTRYACSDGELDAKNKIKRLFLELGLETEVMAFKNVCGRTCQKVGGYNVIGIKRGSLRPNEYYLVGAHYDSTSGMPCRMAPGANDNASGTAGVMELARLFSRVETEASLIFVAFSGEEYNQLGSRKYVRRLLNSGLDKKLKAFVVLDMISYYKRNYGIIVEGSNGTTAQKAMVARLARLGRTYTDLAVETTYDYYGSDHEPFLDRGMAGALLIETDWDRYDYYHTRRDKMVYQDIPYAMEALKLAAALLAEGGIIFPADR